MMVELLRVLEYPERIMNREIKSQWVESSIEAHS